jgi:hypothetical protein
MILFVFCAHLNCLVARSLLYLLLFCYHINFIRDIKPQIFIVFLYVVSNPLLTLSYILGLYIYFFTVPHVFKLTQIYDLFPFHRT